MKKIFVIGGMGAGKSTASKAIASLGVSLIDLDQVGHEILRYETVKEDICNTFGEGVFDPDGEINRRKLAAVAFTSDYKTHLLNNITMPRIEEAYLDRIAELKKDNDYVVVEYSAFKDKDSSLAHSADVIVAVTAPIEVRVMRAVKSGWDEEDIRARLAQQITDAERIELSDVVFANTGEPEELAQKVISWWKDYTSQK